MNHLAGLQWYEWVSGLMKKKKKNCTKCVHDVNNTIGMLSEIGYSLRKCSGIPEFSTTCWILLKVFKFNPKKFALDKWLIETNI